MSIKIFAAGLIAAGLLGVSAAPTMAESSHASRDCFFSNQWDGWRSPSPDVIYIRVGINDVYRLDLSAGSSQLQSPGMHLVNQVRGSNSICSALDLDLSIADTHGFSEPLIVRAMTKLTPAEVAAIPREYRP